MYKYRTAIWIKVFCLSLAVFPKTATQSAPIGTTSPQSISSKAPQTCAPYCAARPRPPRQASLLRCLPDACQYSDVRSADCQSLRWPQRIHHDMQLYSALFPAVVALCASVSEFCMLFESTIKSVDLDFFTWFHLFVLSLYSYCNIVSSSSCAAVSVSAMGAVPSKAAFRCFPRIV